jgi:RNA polymerase sigma-70 factor (ECF subfamily)
VEETDAVLVRLAQQGDAGAFSSLVERHWGRLVPFARSVLGEAEAEDAVQDALVLAWGKLGTLIEPAAFRAWVLRILSRLCCRRARFGRRFLSLVGVPEPSDPAADSISGSIDVERTLRRLAPRQRAVMHLTVVEGMSDSEIGTALGIDAASVRSHRRRARERLRQVLGPVCSPDSVAAEGPVNSRSVQGGE